MWILEPKKIFSFGLNGFYIAAKIDRSTWQHFIFGLLIGLISGYTSIFLWFNIIGFVVMFVKELFDGWSYEKYIGIGNCKQGFDIFDLVFGTLGLLSGLLIGGFF